MYLLKGIMWFMVAMPIIVLFFQEHDLSLAEVMLLQAIYSISVAIFEIPSGYIADIFGRKKTIIFSTIFCFIGYLLFSFYSGFYYFAFAEILVGIGGSLISGSDSAIIYDTLLETKSEKKYTKIEGRIYAIGNFSEASAGILGGFLAVSSIYLPIYIQTFILFFSIPVAMTLVEPKIQQNNKMKTSYISLINVVKETFYKYHKLKWLIIFSSSMGIATLSIAWFAQPFFNELGIPVIYFGVLWAILNFTVGISSFNSHYFERSIEYKKIIITFAIIMPFCYILIGYLNSFLSLIFILLIYILRGIITPILRNYINIITSSNKRATVLSIRSFLIRVSFATTAPLLGYLSDLTSITYSFYCLAIFVGFFSLLSAFKLYNLD